MIISKEIHVQFAPVHGRRKSEDREKYDVFNISCSGPVNTRLPPSLQVRVCSNLSLNSNHFNLGYCKQSIYKSLIIIPKNHASNSGR